MTRLTLAIALGLLGTTSVVNATSTWFAGRSAVANMTDEDRELLTKAMDDILNNESDGSQTEWNNPDTGSRGTLKVAGTHEDFGTTCRLIRMSNTATEITRGGDFRLCRDDEGEWRFAPNPGSS